MARDGSGTYNRVAGTPYVFNTTIDETVVNSELDDVATALTNSIAKDGQTTPTANLPMGGFKHTGLAAGSAVADSVRVSQVQNATHTYLTSVSGTNTITATASPTPAAYVVGQRFVFLPAVTNTGATTLNISSLGGGAVQFRGAALTGGELVANYPVMVHVTAATPVFEIVASAGMTASLVTEDQTLTGGAKVTSKDLGTITTGTVTPDPGDRPLQHYTNGGAHTLGVSANSGSILVDITNDGSAGAITTSAFTKVTGDAFTTTNGHKFRCHVSIGNGGSLLNVAALQ